MKFAHALANPWAEKALGCCLPIEPVRNSQKITGRMTLAVAAGSTGFGFIVVSPTVMNDQAFAWYTNSNFAGTDVTFTPNGNNSTSTTGVASANMTGLPYDHAYYTLTNKSASARLVSVGIKVRSTHALLSRQGQYFANIMPDGTDAVGVTYAEYARYPGAIIRPIDGRAVTLTTGPLDTIGYEWLNPYAIYLNSGGTLTDGYPWCNKDEGIGFNNGVTNYRNGLAPIAIVMTGCTAGQTFLADIIVHMEVCGRQLQGLATQSHNDEVAAKAMLTVANKARQSSPTGPTVTGIIEGVSHTLQSATGLVQAGEAAYGAVRSAYNTIKGVGSAVGKAASWAGPIIEEVEEAGPLLLTL